MRSSETREIDGISFTVQQLPAMRSMKLLHRLVAAAGPALLKSLGNASVASLAAMDVSALGDATQAALDRFTADDLEKVIKELFETATIEQAGATVPLMPVFNDALAGKPGTVLQALKFALEVNYRDFFGVLRASGAGRAAPSPSKA